MKQILNTWTSTTEKLKFYSVDKPVYKNGDWAIYKLFEGSYLYTCQNIAVNNLVGLNREHLDNLANSEAPQRGTNEYLNFTRALDSIDKGFNLLSTLSHV